MNWYKTAAFALLFLCIAATGYSQSGTDVTKTQEMTVKAKEAFMKVHPSARIENYSVPPEGNIACTINGIDGTQRIIFAINRDGSVAEDVRVPDGFPKNGLKLFRERHPDALIKSVKTYRGVPDDGYSIVAYEKGNEVTFTIVATWAPGDDMVCESISMNDVPAPVLDALTKKYPGQKQSNPKRVMFNGELKYSLDIEMEKSGLETATPYVSPDGTIGRTSYRMAAKSDKE